MEKNTLAKIREKSSQRSKREQHKRENYKSPGGGVIIKKFLRDLNREIIEEFCVSHNINKEKTKEMMEQFHKLGYYTPSLTRFLQPEKDFISRNMINTNEE